ncbi:hypothetical protein DVH24_017194 [Malus domestica]|uniref:Uncharacterized protein n=1 Tax=Malus domestica TaxID=3750 RepID=A0A498IXY8_MALDO|nr:hypothetical protein DVH24_017194 [Malus domestica]
MLRSPLASVRSSPSVSGLSTSLASRSTSAKSCPCPSTTASGCYRSSTMSRPVNHVADVVQMSALRHMPSGSRADNS